MKNQDHSKLRNRVLFERGTETPHTGALLNMNDDGNYLCGNCGAPLFKSQAKYDSKTPVLIGWPSFDSAIPGAIEEAEDNTMFMHRTETKCAKCGVHLGHVFPADDAPTGTHYCINSAAIDFCSADNGQIIKGDGS